MSSPRDAGIQALQAGDAKTAIQYFQQALAANPQDPQAHGYMGAAYTALNMPQQAVESLSQAVRYAPQSAVMRFNLGAALERVGQHAPALEAYRASLQLDPSYQRAAQALQRLEKAANRTFAPGSADSPFAAPPPPAAQPLGGIPAPQQQQQYQAPSTGAPPPGMMPLGDWTPPPQEEFGLAAGMTAPVAPPMAPPAAGDHGMTSRDARVMTVEAPERAISRGEQLGHGYIEGMKMGLWWSLIGCFFIFLWATVRVKASDFGEAMPTLLALCGIYTSIGVLLFGTTGLIGASSDIASETCHGIGWGIGVVLALAWWFLNPVGFMGYVQIVGCVAISRYMAKSLGEKIDEWRAAVTVVTGPRGVSMVPSKF